MQIGRKFACMDCKQLTLIAAQHISKEGEGIWVLKACQQNSVVDFKQEQKNLVIVPKTNPKP